MAKRWQDLTDIEKKKYKKIYAFLGIILVVLFGLILATSGGGKSDQPANTAKDKDAAATLACQHFSNVLGDVRDGVLTDSEFRAKMQEVNDDAKVSEDAQVRNSARDLLAAVTSGTTDEVTASTNSLAETCTNYN